MDRSRQQHRWSVCIDRHGPRCQPEFEPKGEGGTEKDIQVFGSAELQPSPRAPILDCQVLSSTDIRHLPKTPHIEEEDCIGGVHAHLLNELGEHLIAVGHISGTESMYSAAIKTMETNQLLTLHWYRDTLYRVSSCPIHQVQAETAKKLPARRIRRVLDWLEES